MYIIRPPWVGNIQEPIETNPQCIPGGDPSPVSVPGSSAMCLESVGLMISRYLRQEDAHTIPTRTAKCYATPCECRICYKRDLEPDYERRDISGVSAISSAPYSLAAHEKLLIEGLKSDPTDSVPSKSGNQRFLAALALETCASQRKDVSVKECPRYSVDIDGVLFEELYPFEYHLIRHISIIAPDNSHFSFPEFRSVKPSGGKSRSRFAVSMDGAYIIKSINQKEEEFLRSSGTAFFWYTSQCVLAGLPSLLNPVLGVFSVTLGKKRNTCILMQNLTKVHGVDSYRVFDLKGVGPKRRAPSTDPSIKPDTDADLSPGDVENIHDRDVGCGKSGHECSGNPSLNRMDMHVGSHVLLDEDFRLLNNGSALKLEPNSFRFLQSALHNDTLFLSCLQIVDYSLLLAVEKSSDRGSPEIIAGIIDYLRPFTWEKRLESVVKTVNINLTQIGSILSRGENEEPHCELAVAPTIIRPELYARRFRTNILSLFSSPIP